MVENVKVSFYPFTPWQRQTDRTRMALWHYWWNEHGFGDFSALHCPNFIRFTFVKNLHGASCINITSFFFCLVLRVLKPYHQAHERGGEAELGATALPLCDIRPWWRANHCSNRFNLLTIPYFSRSIVAVGRDTGKTVCVSESVTNAPEHRVFMYGNKSVVF